MFQHTAARRRLTGKNHEATRIESFNTQPPEGGWGKPFQVRIPLIVSTHSRPKAAAWLRFRLAFKRRFNTQPPEGGCLEKWVNLDLWNVSTHSRPKAAERGRPIILSNRTFQHTAARRRLPLQRCLSCFQRSFNTQPPEGGWESIGLMPSDTGVSTHSRPKAAGKYSAPYISNKRFQHTAARRRLQS